MPSAARSAGRSSGGFWDRSSAAAANGSRSSLRPDLNFGVGKERKPMFDPTEAIEKLQAEIDRTIKEFSKARNTEEKLKLSEVLKNLTQSLNVYFDFLSTVIDSELDRFDDEEDEEII
jgi:hypothetical protein